MWIRGSEPSSPQSPAEAPQSATCRLSISEQLCLKAPLAPRSEEALRQGRGGQPALMGFSVGLAANPPAQVHQEVERYSFHPHCPTPNPRSLDETHSSHGGETRECGSHCPRMGGTLSHSLRIRDGDPQGSCLPERTPHTGGSGEAQNTWIPNSSVND